MIHKRQSLSRIFAFILILLLFCGCGSNDIKSETPPANVGDGAIEKTEQTDQTEEDKFYSGFSVHYLDVGQGDCIFIHFEDGKNMLIDSGAFSRTNGKYITEYLSAYSVTTIDYFILTHPDYDHVGNAVEVIENFTIGTAYIPDIISLERFPDYKPVYDILIEKSIPTEYSQFGKKIVGDGYGVAFLSPAPKNQSISSYRDLNGATVPTAQQINDVSPIIYLEAYGKRFLFTGDAGFSQEEYVLGLYKTGLYSRLFKDINVSLTSIDYLKVSHHGATDASGEEFLRELTPKNAIISVGGGNLYGHPDSNTLIRINTANPECEIFRTDLSGTIVVHKKEDGSFSIATDKVD